MAKLVKIESTAQMAFTPPSGYITSTIGEMEGQITELIKKSDGTIVTIGGGGGGSDVYVVVDDNGVLKAQKLSFNGTEASFDGTAETLDATRVGLFATTQDEPAYKGSGGGGAFYKCASVDTAAKTWTGYLAVLGEEGTYSFEEAVTEGLTYTSVTPAVGKTYSADALVTVGSLYVGIPIEGLVFYAPLSSQTAQAETGQSITANGDISYDEKQGIASAFFSTQSSYAQSTVTLENPNSVTVSFWAFISSEDTSQSQYNYPRFLCLGDSSTSDNSSNWICFTWAVSEGNFTFQNPDNGSWASVEMSAIKDQWVHFVGILNDNGLTLYRNGTLVGSEAMSNTSSLPTNSTVYINYVNNAYNGPIAGNRMAGLRIYDRVLTAEEIGTLASELTPTA